MKDLLSIYVPANRTKLMIAATILAAAIAVADWLTRPFISLGFLYLFPIMMVSGFLSRKQILGVAMACAVLQEAFSNLPPNEAVVRLVFSSAGFLGTGLFISELIRNRRMVLQHVAEVETQAERLRDAEEQLRILIESSPAAIVTIDLNGKILLANEAAQQVLDPGAPALSLQGRGINSFLPSLETAVQTQPSRLFRTALQCRGQRSNGEAFLAGVWFSTYHTLSGPRLAAIVVDLSEDLRDREDLSLDHLLKNARIFMSAAAHEIRNLCSAMFVVHKNLSRVRALEQNADFRALSTLMQSLERISTQELRSATDQSAGAVELTSVFDELRILIDTTYHESGIEIQWRLSEALPLVWADRYELIQVFLNLARNSQRAMQSMEPKQLSITAFAEQGTVVIRFEDTGKGITAPENLFRPFQRGADSTGLGLFVSRAILRSFGGELVHEPTTQGCCFRVVLPAVSVGERAVNA